VHPRHLPSLSVLAATYFLEGEASRYEEIRSRVESLNPTYADLYTTVGEAAVAQRQYRIAVELARKAVQVDPSSWHAYGVLGMNQLRIGEVEEGRASLEAAFRGDPYNPWYKNSLDLLDTFNRFEVVTTRHFLIYLRSSEAELLGPYAAKVAEEAFSALRDRYGASPPTPIRLELYSSHADFSVRTLGMTGLGALGVSFGSTLVMDSPSALEPGSFNWASTLWHETAHAFHLAMSDHRVPRWFTEGLAVHEQHQARTDWGHKASPAWLQAYHARRLHPVSRLNEGFIRPEYPEQVPFSYYQASVVFDLIESRWGLPAILAMLDGYRQGKSNEEVFREVLGESPEAFENPTKRSSGKSSEKARRRSTSSSTTSSGTDGVMRCRR
jgi:tetratricopeptide (TPR) repeat protein